MGFLLAGRQQNVRVYGKTLPERRNCKFRQDFISPTVIETLIILFSGARNGSRVGGDRFLCWKQTRSHNMGKETIF